jgi:hypothetical protein
VGPGAVIAAVPPLPSRFWCLHFRLEALSWRWSRVDVPLLTLALVRGLTRRSKITDGLEEFGVRPGIAPFSDKARVL